MAETNTAALRAQGERDARALTVTGRRRADTGRIRCAAKALARMARARSGNGRARRIRGPAP